MSGRVETFLSYLMAFDVTLSDTLLLDHEQAVAQVMDIYAHRKFIEPIPTEKDGKTGATLFGVVENRRANLEYYKNNCIGCLVPAAFTALSILNRDAFQFSESDLPAEYQFLQTLFEQEFAVDLEKTPACFIGKTIEAFVGDAILMPHPTLPDTYNITSAGFRKLGLFAQLLKPYFESYLVVLDFLLATPKNDGSAKDRLKKIQGRGQKMYKSREIERVESLSKINYQNALDQLSAMGLKGAEDEEAIGTHLDKLRKYLSRMS